MNIEIIEHDRASDPDFLLQLAGDVFAEFDPAYLKARLPVAIDPILVIARDDAGPAGFKFGYREGTNFYSWLGGVHPQRRRQGLASRLMIAQHKHVHSLGYKTITTRTFASNQPMIILNLKHGFEIVGFEINHVGLPVVSQRKVLTS